MRDHRPNAGSGRPVRETFMRGHRPLGDCRQGAAAMTHARYQLRPGGQPAWPTSAGARWPWPQSGGPSQQ
jgi:hypothetical protein